MRRRIKNAVQGYLVKKWPGRFSFVYFRTFNGKRSRKSHFGFLIGNYWYFFK